MQPLVSIVVLSYNNLKYLFESIDSVLQQEYPSIELIISDDFSDIFDADAVIEYVNDKRKNNLKNVRLNINSFNRGTVWSFENMLPMCNGEYVYLLAGDDCFHDAFVISSFVEAFDGADSSVMAIIGQTLMYDNTLKKHEYNFLSDAEIHLLNTGTHQEVFNKLAEGCFIPASVCYKKEIFDQLGIFSNHYTLVEDYPKFLRIARKEIPYIYKDISVLKHRGGGISHGNENGSLKKQAQYLNDLFTCYALEIDPYKHLLYNDTAYKMSNLRSELSNKFYKSYPLLVSTLWEDHESSTFKISKKDKIKNIIYRIYLFFSKKEHLVSTAIISLLLLILSFTAFISFKHPVLLFFEGVIFLAGLFGLSISFAIILYKLYRKVISK